MTDIIPKRCYDNLIMKMSAMKIFKRIDAKPAAYPGSALVWSNQSVQVTLVGGIAFGFGDGGDS